MTNVAFDIDIARLIKERYESYYELCDVIVVPSQVEGFQYTATVVLKKLDTLINVMEIKDIGFSEERGFHFTRVVTYQHGKYDIAKDTVREFMQDAFSLNYKEYAFYYGNEDEKGNSTVFINLGPIFMACLFNTYTQVEEGCEHTRGSLHNFRFLGVNDITYRRTATVVPSSDLPTKPPFGFEIKYKPDDIKSLTHKNLERLEEITLERAEEFFNTVTLADADKDFFHAVALYYGLEHAIRFFYIKG